MPVCQAGDLFWKLKTACAGNKFGVGRLGMENMEFKSDEEFKDCPCNRLLQVSQYGRVKIKGGNLLKQTVLKEYLIVENPGNNFPFEIEGTNKKMPFEWVHRLVAFTWLGEKKENDMVVHHINGNTFNNQVDNLEWITRKEHAKKHGGDIDKDGNFYIDGTVPIGKPLI